MVNVRSGDGIPKEWGHRPRELALRGGGTLANSSVAQVRSELMLRSSGGSLTNQPPCRTGDARFGGVVKLP